MTKKVFIIFSIFALIACARPPKAHAFFEWFENLTTEISESVADNLGKFSDQFMERVQFSAFNSIFQVGEASPHKAGLLNTTSNLIAATYNRPVKSSEYVAYVLHNTHIVPQAYAQGIGFSGLSPILSVWKAFRDMVYFAYIIVFVIIGFMIMFRQKISSNAVLTIQEALPKLIITLLLITFSYAIAGFVIDLMYFSIFLIMAVFERSGLIASASKATNVLLNRNIIGIGISYFTGFTEPAGAAAEAIGALVAQVVGGALGVVANILFYLIFAVAVLIAVFRTFFQLLMAYISIILNTIFAPIRLLPNAFPGNDSFNKWLRGLIANAAVFPAACVMIILGIVLSGANKPIIPGTENATTAFGLIPQDNPPGFEEDGFMPPLVYSAGMEQLNEDTTNGNATGGSVSAIRTLIGFGIIMLLPEVVKMVKEALEVKESDFSSALKMATSGTGVVRKPYDAVAGEVREYQQQKWDATLHRTTAPTNPLYTPSKTARDIVLRMLGMKK